MKADLDDVESLKKAFAGAYGVYAVTNFWEHFSGEKEKAQAKNIADAAKAAGVKHVIWSTLEDTRKLMKADDKRMPMLQEKYRVPHFDAKAEANAYFAGVPTTFLVTSFYWDNLYMFGLAPKKGDDGQYAWTFPMGTAKMAGIAAEDIGKVAYGIFKAGTQYVGKTVGIVGEALTIDEMGKKLSKGLGIGPVKYNAVDADVYRSFGFPGADEMGNMFQVYRDFEKEMPGRAQRRYSAQAEPGPADVRAVRQEQEGRDPARDGLIRAGQAFGLTRTTRTSHAALCSTASSVKSTSNDNPCRSRPPSTISSAPPSLAARTISACVLPTMTSARLRGTPRSAASFSSRFCAPAASSS